jgi:hypothetical protein
MVSAQHKKRIATLVRLLGTPERGERAKAWRMLERAMTSASVSWTDLGNWIEQGDTLRSLAQAMERMGINPNNVVSWIKDGGENDMRAIYDAALQEGIKRGMQQKNGNGHIMLPEPSEMAEFCRQRLNQLKDDKQRDFVGDMYLITRRGMNLSRGRLGYLVSLYIQVGGQIQ